LPAGGATTITNDVGVMSGISQGRIQTKVKLSNLHKIGIHENEIGKKSGKLLTKSGKIGTFT